MILGTRWHVMFFAMALLSTATACGVDDRDLSPADAAREGNAGGSGPATDATHGDAAATVDTGASSIETDARRPSGSILWARSTSSLYLYGLAQSSTGIVVTGTISAPADLGGTLLVPVGSTDTVLAQFASSDAAHQSSARLGRTGDGGAGEVYGFIDVVDPASTPLIHGLSYGNVDLGAGTVPGGGGTGADGFVGRYQLNGKPSWVKRLVGPGDDHFTSVTNGPNNTIFVSGWYDANTAFDVTHTFNAAGYRDIFFMQLDYGGAVVMEKTFATSGFEQPNSIAWTGTHLMAAGFFNPTTAIGRFSLTAIDYGIWAGKFLPDGTPEWVVGFSGPGKDHNPSMTIDAAGDMYIAGTFTGSITFGSYDLTGAGSEVFAVKLRNADGSVAWATSLGSAGDDLGGDIALNATGELILAATVAGPLEPGGPFAGGTDVALVSFDTSGARRWAKVIGTGGTDSASAVSSGTDAFYASINLGGNIGMTVEDQPIVGAPKPAGLVLKLQP